jgi:hypothetical protein
MHDEIRRFGIEGQIADINIVDQKQRLVDFQENRMREEGCVPSLDLDPQFTLDYDAESETFNFALSVYGVYVGEDSWQVAGVSSGTTIQRFTPKVK